jgi:hypothetical protein
MQLGEETHGQLAFDNDLLPHSVHGDDGLKPWVILRFYYGSGFSKTLRDRWGCTAF